MAPTKGDDDGDGDEKRTTAFRCLDAGRYVVAAAVTVLIFAVIVYAVTVVLRPGDLALWIVGGSISVERNGGDTFPSAYDVGGNNGTLPFRFTVRAVNPSGRLRIYFTNITVTLRGRNSSSAMNPFLKLFLPDIAVAQLSTVDSNVQAIGKVTRASQEYYFKALANDSSIVDASLKLNGTRIVENYSGHNMTGERAVYYCSRLAVGSDDDGTAAVDTPCTEDQPTSS